MATNNPGDHVRYEVIAQEDDDDNILLPIPQVLLDQMGWKEGDTIDFGLDDINQNPYAGILLDNQLMNLKENCVSMEMIKSNYIMYIT